MEKRKESSISETPSEWLETPSEWLKTPSEWLETPSEWLGTPSEWLETLCTAQNGDARLATLSSMTCNNNSDAKITTVNLTLELELESGQKKKSFKN